MKLDRRHYYDAIAQRTACGKSIVLGLLTNVNGGEVTCRACNRSTEVARRRTTSQKPIETKEHSDD